MCVTERREELTLHAHTHTHTKWISIAREATRPFSRNLGYLIRQRVCNNKHTIRNDAKCLGSSPLPACWTRWWVSYLHFPPSLITSFLKHTLSTSLCLLIPGISNARTTRIYPTKYILEISIQIPATYMAHCCHLYLIILTVAYCRSQWPRGLRRRSRATRLLRSWVRIPPGEWMSVCSECCMLSGRGLCDELITRPEEPYRLWCVVVCDLETTKNPREWGGDQGPLGGYRSKRKKNYMLVYGVMYSHREVKKFKRNMLFPFSWCKILLP